MSAHIDDRRPGIRRTVTAVLLVAATLVGSFFYVFTQVRQPSTDALRKQGLVVFEQARELPQFTLRNDRGEAFGPGNLKGQWSLVFFGYTYCPDICPTTMALLRQFYEALPAEQRLDTRVILASADPARDTVERLREYVGYFHEDFRGVTGEFLEVHRFATGLSIPFAKVPGGGDNYLVEHSGNIAVVNPHGHYVAFYKVPLSLEQLQNTYEALRKLRS